MTGIDHCPDWCSGVHCTAHDDPNGQHRSAPAEIMVPAPYGETIRVSLMQTPGAAPRVYVESWEPGEEDEEPTGVISVPAVVAEQFRHAVAAAVATVTGPRARAGTTADGAR